MSLEDPSLLADTAGVAFGVLLVLVVLLGGVVFTEKARYPNPRCGCSSGAARMLDY